MDGEVRRDAEQLLVQGPQALRGHRGLHGLPGARRRRRGLLGWGGRRLGDRCAQPFVGGAERRDDLVGDLLRLLGGEHTVVDEAIRVLLARGALGLDLLDLERLRVGRVVLLVVRR